MLGIGILMRTMRFNYLCEKCQRVFLEFSSDTYVYDFKVSDELWNEIKWHLAQGGHYVHIKEVC